MKCADVRPWPAVGRWADCNPCYLCLKTGTPSSPCKKVIYRFKCVSTAYCSFSTPYWRWQWSDHGVSSSLIASWGPKSTDIKTLFSEMSYMRRGRLSFCVICIDFFFFVWCVKFLLLDSFLSTLKNRNDQFEVGGFGAQDPFQSTSC